MELWERTEAFDLLDALLHAGTESGRVALVAAEAGMGKSSLVADFTRRRGQRARVLWGACDQLVTPRALGPLHDIARTIRGPLAAGLLTGASREEVFAAFLDEVAGPGPVLVVVEDVHWADEATLDWLTQLGRHIAGLPVLLVVTFRDDEVGPDHPLRRTLAALPARAVTRIPLAPLSEDCVLEQARRAGRTPEIVYRLAGGNPLLVTELLKADDSAVPGAVQDLVLNRLRALPADARDLAQLVAVVPTRADALLVADELDAVDTCLAAGVLVAAGDGVAFRHELLRTAVEESLSPMRRMMLHRRVLERLAGAPDVDPGRLVHHARSAGDDDAVLRYGRVAGAAAARTGAHREAAAHYRAAAAVAERLVESERAELLESYATEALLAGLHQEGLEAAQTALTLREQRDEPDEISEDLRLVSRLAWWTGDARQSHDAATRAVAVLEAGPPGRQLALAYGNLAHRFVHTYEFDEAVAWGERSLALAERLDDDEIAIHAATIVNAARLCQEAPGAAEALEQLHQHAIANGLFDHAHRALGNLASIMSDDLARYDAAAPLIDRALAFAEQHDLDAGLAWLLGQRAKLRLERGDWNGALADADTALARSGPRGANAVMSLTVRGRVQAARGAPDALAGLDEAARQADRVGDAQWVVPVADARSEYFLWADDTERAQEEARRGIAIAGGEHGLPFVVGRLAYRLWKAGGTDELPATIAEPYRLMIDGAWSEAAAEWARRGGRYLRAEALAAGDEDAANEALRILDDLGANRSGDHLRRQLRRRGFARVPRGPRPTTASHIAGLTVRQAEILAMVGEGLSNGEIAARLVVSVRTVDHHVSAVLAKLGVTNRREAAAIGRQLAATPTDTG